MVKDDWDEWLLHPVTVEFRKAMKHIREDIKEQMANGNYSTETVDGTAQLYAEAVGKAMQLDDLLNASYEGVTEDAASSKHS